MIIREESKEDIPAIGILNRKVFGGEYEARVIDALRSANLVLVSLVALDGDAVKGHILFSKLQVEIDGRAVDSAALGPLAVSPECQRQGIGSRLVTEGLARIKKKQVAAVMVLGRVEYYSRFGFSSSLTQNLASPFHGNPHFMALELVPGILSGQKGSVIYPGAFELGPQH